MQCVLFSKIYLFEGIIGPLIVTQISQITYKLCVLLSSNLLLRIKLISVRKHFQLFENWPKMVFFDLFLWPFSRMTPWELVYCVRDKYNWALHFTPSEKARWLGCKTQKTARQNLAPFKFYENFNFHYTIVSFSCCENT